MGIRPFVLPTESQRDRVAVVFERVVDAWRREWGVEAPFHVTVVGWDGAGVDWRHSGLGSSPCWFTWPGTTQPDFSHALFGQPSSDGASFGPIAGVVGAAASAALQADLLAVMGLTPLASGAVSGAAPTPRPGDGMSNVRISCGNWEAALLLTHEACARLAPPVEIPALPALAALPFTGLFSPQPQTLRVELGEARARMGQLASLRVGDVIRLSSTLVTSLTLRTTDGRLVASGQLGQQGGHRALLVDAI